MTLVEAQHIGRRCKLRLIDEVRRQTGFNKKREQRNHAFLTALETLKHLHWIPDRAGPYTLAKLHIRNATRNDASNTTIARDWYRSEGWIRKRRKRLAAQIWSMVKNDAQRQALEVLRLKPASATDSDTKI